ncbi:MAG: methylmalonyl Co-A mutase-associated GTPase MeaB [Candidatus Thermoplasmatota archaeon]|nr:methylmalonyl Co-A mutase-associated GTPase MeaB [Candidatus Thermoplasmatota archaeon]MCL5987978.1 methylmalonyl Co-A mutase-associated GTPase MeaB [Candidatus Thermoplasmatota archaeon]
MTNIGDLVEGVVRSDRRSIARAISYMEDGHTEIKKEIMEKLYSHCGKAHVVGITGPPGIGKSTLIGNISVLLAQKGMNVSVLAVDASSPYSGGSLLGNRIRMQENLFNYGIYMRSLANRGARGGLSVSCMGAVNVLDASGSEIILIETVGAGQADLDIMNLADTTILVLGPGLGDQIQAIKAGIMEIADLFVINKMDIDGSYFAMKDIEEVISMDDPRGFRRRVTGTSATDHAGYDELVNTILDHGRYISGEGIIGRKRFLMGARWILESEIGRIIIDPAMDIIKKKGTDKNPYVLAENIISQLNAGVLKEL